MQLCEKLGFPTPRHLLANMLPEELTDWHAYYRIINEARHGGEKAEEALDLTDPGAQAELMAAFTGMKQSGMKVRVEHG